MAATELPARVPSKETRRDIIAVCKAGIAQDELEKIAELVRFCSELAKPVNHVRVKSGHYEDKEVNTRTVADMTNEAAHELSRIPRYTAFPKIIDEGEGRQEV